MEKRKTPFSTNTSRTKHIYIYEKTHSGLQIHQIVRTALLSLLLLLIRLVGLLGVAKSVASECRLDWIGGHHSRVLGADEWVVTRLR